MSRQFALTAQGATGNVANTFKTMLAVILANTLGHRVELRALSVSGGGGAPQDLQCRVRVNRTGNNTAGTPGASPTPATKDANSLASLATAGTVYSAEPTTYETQPLYEAGFNCRGGHTMSWPKGGGPKAGINHTLGILVAPCEATAANVVLTVEYDEY